MNPMTGCEWAMLTAIGKVTFWVVFSLGVLVASIFACGAFFWLVDE